MGYIRLMEAYANFTEAPEQEPGLSQRRFLAPGIPFKRLLASDLPLLVPGLIFLEELG
jgi:hypothetical protein